MARGAHWSWSERVLWSAAIFMRFERTRRSPARPEASCLDDFPLGVRGSGLLERDSALNFRGILRGGIIPSFRIHILGHLTRFGCTPARI
jgi:hypothetical protein